MCSHLLRLHFLLNWFITVITAVGMHLAVISGLMFLHSMRGQKKTIKNNEYEKNTNDNTRNAKLEGSCTYEFMEHKHGQIFCKSNNGIYVTF